jgi:ATP-dependent RNA helicase DeaD
MKFEELNLSRELLLAIKKLGHNEPMEIQCKSIPHIMKGRDVMGESATGSGKTLAFGCGVIEKVEPRQGLQSLILTPTRELAEQVKKSIKEVSTNLKVISVYGGVSITTQISELTKAEVVVATPGRLLDHLQRRTINLSRVKILVLDEADRMLDMGFMDDVEKIIRSCPSDRQTLFFSATLSGVIGNLARKYMKDPIKVSVANFVDPSKLKQTYYDIGKNIKLSLLVHLLENERAGLVMVFCNTRRTTDFVVKVLKANKIRAIAIHGGLTQNKRARTLGDFNDAKVEVLVCTDVAARGLHINNVSHVYNYDIPRDPTDYVHRIGRTARAGEEGKIINLLSRNEHTDFSKVQRDYSFEIERVEKPALKSIVTPGKHVKRKPSFNRSSKGRGFGNRNRAPSKGRFEHKGSSSSSGNFSSKSSSSSKGRFGNKSSSSSKGRFGNKGSSSSSGRFGNRGSSSNQNRSNNSDRKSSFKGKSKGKTFRKRD